MAIQFSTRFERIPSFFQMPCIACDVAGKGGQAVGVVTATSGLGLGSCVDHVESTGRALRTLSSYELAEFRALLAGAGEPPQDRATGEGVVYGSLPGSGGQGRSHSVADVMFGRIPR
ncbi:hypothetical protein ACIO6T_44640 [Streptomyces sp. NPDC087532]|uniref:hypothetical protein n=1 Tax=Streptomyces sp. NPDC087532 TaxID=3365795 RepID=UPI003823B141